MHFFESMRGWQLVYEDSVNTVHTHTSAFINLLNRSLQELWDLTPIMILTIFFCNVNTFLPLAELPQKIILYFIKE
jgi:hypothetical protein